SSVLPFHSSETSLRSGCVAEARRATLAIRRPIASNWRSTPPPLITTFPKYWSPATCSHAGQTVQVAPSRIAMVGLRSRRQVLRTKMALHFSQTAGSLSAGRLRATGGLLSALVPRRSRLLVKPLRGRSDVGFTFLASQLGSGSENLRA